MKRDFQKSRIIWYLLFSYTRLRCLHCVMKPQNFTETLTSQLSKKRWANSSAYLHFNHTLCRFSISLSLSLSHSLFLSFFLSVTKKNVTLCLVSFVSSLRNDDLNTDADSLKDFPPPVYILLMPKWNLMVKTRHIVTVFVLVLFLICDGKTTD